MALYSASPRIIFMTSSMSAFTSSMPATSSKRTPVSRRSTPTLNSVALCLPNSSASSCAWFDNTSARRSQIPQWWVLMEPGIMV